jgi:hypothetical protein
MTSPVKISSAPGIKRDGTVLEGQNYTDGQWCRFQRGRPRKIGGYQAVSSTVPEVARGMTSFSANGLRYLHIGGASNLTQYIVTGSGSLSAQNTRTPVGFSDPQALWQFDHFFDGVTTLTDVIAHPGRNLVNIDSTFETAAYLGDVVGSAALTEALTLPGPTKEFSGGIVTLGPFLFFFGNSGQIGWSEPNDPTTVDAEAFITQQKIVAGHPLRGAGQGPAGIFWSLDALIRASFVGGTVVWQFDTLASDVSILSSQAVIEYDGTFFWPGVDRWLMFNGVVRDVPNDFNINFFFDNLNFSERQKVFAFKVPRFHEIWWCYPRGGATECTHAIIFNVKEGSWYDTELPTERSPGNVPGRTAGIYARVYNKPFLVDADDVGAPGTDAFTLWQHETGVDEIDGSSIVAVESFFETAEIGMPVDEQQPSNMELRVARMEPDFVQSGDMTLNVRGRVNSKAPFVEDAAQTFLETPVESTDETIKLKTIRRLMSFKFTSNVVGGDYEFGETLAHLDVAGERTES